MSECYNCAKPLRLFRLGRAHFCCIECGYDMTLELLMMHDSGVNLDLVPMTRPEDYK